MESNKSVLSLIVENLKKTNPSFVEEYLFDFKIGAGQFSMCTGLIKKDDKSSLALSLEVQAEQVLEEVGEFNTALTENDKVEMVDGILDTIFTVVNFDLIIDMLSDGKGVSGLLPEELSIYSKVRKSVENLVENIHLLDVKSEDLIKSAQLINENNKLKYTSYKNEALSWEIDLSDNLDTKLVETSLHDLKFYCLKDCNGKVKKHKNFQKVDLEWLNGK